MAQSSVLNVELNFLLKSKSFVAIVVLKERSFEKLHFKKNENADF